MFITALCIILVCPFKYLSRNYEIEQAESDLQYAFALGKGENKLQNS